MWANHCDPLANVSHGHSIPFDMILTILDANLQGLRSFLHPFMLTSSNLSSIDHFIATAGGALT